ncbi:hypothetical protein PGT21_016800 [Puccinia graminis f. sp. tritici]|uniref:Uncharacterized protein n=1 Tax=Puccinia graminis f. sp. tritici TaxID=56615 RepID=A0A5B0PXR7_PUCGR|nr:hypothetical protein PGT21_016800 [Puccinia graminis f. sp. tritici]
MQFPGALSLMTLLVSFAIQTRAVYPPPNDYLMSDKVDWANGYLSVYSANGKDAFRYGRDKNQPNSGTNRHRLMDGSGNQLFEVYSANEGCIYDWEYNSMSKARVTGNTTNSTKTKPTKAVGFIRRSGVKLINLKAYSEVNTAALGRAILAMSMSSPSL